jgi:hypothetical protein
MYSLFTLFTNQYKVHDLNNLHNNGSKLLPFKHFKNGTGKLDVS